MTKRPEALMLADYFSMFKTSSHLLADGTPLHIAAETELRRLHALCEEQKRLLEQAREALNESVDVCENEYKTDWRHGVPTRAAQLTAMKETLDQHKTALTVITNHLRQHEGEKHD